MTSPAVIATVTTSALPAEIEELFGAGLAAQLRRTGERPQGGGPVADEQQDARAAVWATLAGAGVLDSLVDRTESPGQLLALGELMGAVLYRSPYLDTAAAAELISASRWFGDDVDAGDAGAAEYADVLDAVADGVGTVALAVRAEGTDDPADPAPLTLGDGPDGPWVSGRRRFVAFADTADWLLLVGTVPGGTALALVRADDPGVTVRRQDDISRGDLHAVELRQVPLVGGALLADPAAARPLWRDALARIRVRQAAVLTGMARGAVDLAVERVRDRVQFDQPLARHQSVAFRLAALTARTTAVRAFAEETAAGLGGEAHSELNVLHLLAMAADLARDAAAQSLHLHGAHGMTEAADIQLYFRRAALEAVLWGSPAQLRSRAADLL